MKPVTIFFEGSELSRLARELAKIEGTSIADAIRRALIERRSRLLNERQTKRLRVDAALARLDALPVQDQRDHAEMLYGEDGLPR